MVLVCWAWVVVEQVFPLLLFHNCLLVGLVVVERAARPGQELRTPLPVPVSD